MTTATIDIDELLEARPDIQHGQACIRGTGITVQRVVGLHLDHQTPDEILVAFPAATLAGIHAALAYYYAHRAALDAEDEREGVEAEAAARALGIEII